MKLFTIICALLPFALSKLAPCAVDKGALPKSVIIHGCPNEEDCDFSRNKVILGDFEFVAPIEITSLRPVIYMTLGANRNQKAETDAPYDREFGCEWLLEGSKCPLAKGKTATWRLNLPIDPMEKIAKGALEIQMRAQDNSTVFCAVIWGEVYAF